MEFEIIKSKNLYGYDMKLELESRVLKISKKKT